MEFTLSFARAMKAKVCRAFRGNLLRRSTSKALMKAYKKLPPLYLFVPECGVDYALKLPIKSFPQSQMNGVLE